MQKMYDGKSNTKGLRNAQKYSNTKECNCLVFILPLVDMP